MHHNDYKNHLKQVFQGDDIKRQAHIVLVLFLPFFAFSSLVLIEASFSDEQELERRIKKTSVQYSSTNKCLSIFNIPI